MIVGKRIRSTKGHVPELLRDHKLIFGVPVADVPDSKLKAMGFQTPLSEGMTVLPTGDGPITRYNEEGKIIVHKDKPKETHYRQREWTWKEWHGRYDQVEQSKIVDVPYKRYPRTEVPPPSIELTIGRTPSGKLICVTPAYRFTHANEEEIVHAINLILENFGECQFYQQDMKELVQAPVRRLNWHVLPPGKRPWKDLKKDVLEILREAPKGNQPVIEFRWEKITNYNPEFVAVGQGGFRGYLIFAFPSKKLYILESRETDNATYVLGSDWEKLSQKTKAELIHGSLHKDRIVHRKSWLGKIAATLS
jgi:hypothetical protein